MRKILNSLIGLLATYYLFAGLASVAICCLWNRIDSAEIAPNSQMSRFQSFLHGFWHSATGAALLASMFLLVRKRESAGRWMLALGSFSAMIISVGTFSAWIHLNRTFDLMELLFTIPILGVFVKYLYSPGWNERR